MEGIKHDDDKPRVHEVLSPFSRALLEVARVGTRGLRKYPEADNWLRVQWAESRYTDAMLRHYLAEQTSATDTETGMLHAAHLAWNALARLELMLREQECGARATGTPGPQPPVETKTVFGWASKYEIPYGDTSFDNLSPVEVDIAMRERKCAAAAGGVFDRHWVEEAGEAIRADSANFSASLSTAEARRPATARPAWAHLPGEWCDAVPVKKPPC